LVTGEQSFKKYCQDASGLFKDYFIPSDTNDNRPKILRPKQLTIIAILLIILKVSLIGYLFSVYQGTAEMSETTISQLLILTNESRVASGALPVELNPILNQAAQSKAEDMLINNYFSHTSPDGRKPWNFVNRSAYPYLLVGENLGMNFIAASDVHAALMASPSHQKNLLNPKYTDVGLAVVNGELNGENTNILVEIFAYKKEATETIAITPTAPGADTFTAVVVDSEVLTVEDKPEVIAEIIPLLTAGTETPNSEPVSSPTTEIIVASETETKVDVLAQVQGVMMPVLSTMQLPVEEPNNTLQTINNVNENGVGLVPIPVSTTEIRPELIETPVEDLLSVEELPAEPIIIDTNSSPEISRAGMILKVSKLLYVFFLVFLIISLLINIFVRITVQHKSVIMQTVLLIILLVALIIFNFGFMTELKNAASNIVLF